MQEEWKKKPIRSFEDLLIYQRLLDLVLRVSELSLSFPKFELYELGSQVRRSSNAIAANLAEGWNNRHTKIYLEGINRSLGELRETRHHLKVAQMKGYLELQSYRRLDSEYAECQRMLKGLERSLLQSISPPST